MNFFGVEGFKGEAIPLFEEDGPLFNLLLEVPRSQGT
jgi:hypothetical protein